MRYKLLFATISISLTLLLTGCKTFCDNNVADGMALITCQPLDGHAMAGPVIFEVKADGNIFAHRWYFRGNDNNTVALVDGAEVTGATTSQLTLKNWTKSGVVFCEIEAWDEGQNARTTRTRDARIGYQGRAGLAAPAQKAGQIAFSALTTNITWDVVQHGPMGSSGGPYTGSCCNFCGYVPYYNGNAGYQPPTGSTSALLSVVVGTSGVPLNTSLYCIRWKHVGASTAGCTAIDSATEMTMSVNPSKKYLYTVYFKQGNCPAPNTDVILQIDWRP